MLRGIKLRRELISILLLSCLAAGAGFVALPSKLAEAAGSCKITSICDRSGSLRLLSCRSIRVFCVRISGCQVNCPAGGDSTSIASCDALAVVKGTTAQLLLLVRLLDQRKLGDGEKQCSEEENFICHFSGSCENPGGVIAGGTLLTACSAALPISMGVRVSPSWPWSLWQPEEVFLQLAMPLCRKGKNNG